MILIQHADAAERHLERIKQAAQARNDVLFLKEIDSAAAIEKTEILFTYGKGITLEILKAMPFLKWIQLSATGIDHMPKDYIRQNGIQLTTVKGAHVGAIAEYAFSCMLYFIRKMDLFQELQRHKKWYRSDFPGELAGKKLVVLGTGEIGREIAKKALAFSMQTTGVNSSGRAADYFQNVYPAEQLHEILPVADFLILALPLTNKTFGIIGKTELSLLKSTAVVINLGRGELMDEGAAYACLRSKRIRGMALDVFCQEPLPEDSPFWDVPGLVLTPHMAAKTDRFLDRCFDVFIENYEKYINGKELINRADYTKGY